MTSGCALFRRPSGLGGYRSYRRGYASLTHVCIVAALHGFRNHTIANPVGFDNEDVVVTWPAIRS
ncbi:MAG: hypothetical protein IKR48_10440 [Kiritimatiellae bacterium]|nr:hypothetical protein [Kiritimatiellia bacterium]